MTSQNIRFPNASSASRIRQAGSNVTSHDRMVMVGIHPIAETQPGSNIPVMSYPPVRLRFARILGHSFRPSCAVLMIVLFPACRSPDGAPLNGREFSNTTRYLDQAEHAWRALQQEEPGTPSAQKNLAMYDQAVTAIVRSLHAKEGTAAWGQDMVMDGARPWRVALERHTRNGTLRTFALSEFSRCQVASDIKLDGFDRVLAHAGIGVPVVLTQEDFHRVAQPFHASHGEFLPATVVLEFSDPVPGRTAEARLRFYNPMTVSVLQVGARAVPLAANLTAPMQFSLTDSTVDENGPHKLAPSASGEDESRLFFIHRYDKTKVPVVFVHGLRSGPVVWKNAVNELLADPDLRRRYQPVCFVYPSGLPIPTSAARLRELLRKSREKFDPDHKDAGFDQMVLVGHSMGGLVARMQVIDSGMNFWRSFYTASPQKIAAEVDAATLKMVKGSLVFQHQPNVKTVVFISTPHQGSELADISALRAVARIILLLPKTARKQFKALTALPPAYINPMLRSFNDWGNNGVENLSTKHPYFKALAQRTIRVPFHSVIAVGDAINPHDGSDGVVPYRSAHLEGAVTETIVPYPHGCVERSGTVQAVLKILKGSKTVSCNPNQTTNPQNHETAQPAHHHDVAPGTARLRA